MVFKDQQFAVSLADTVVRWLVPQNGILDAVRVPVNGTVTFSWTSLHDLWEIPSAQCPTTFTNGSGITQIARQTTGGTATLTFPQERVRYFACSVSNHCSQGICLQHYFITLDASG